MTVYDGNRTVFFYIPKNMQQQQLLQKNITDIIAYEFNNKIHNHAQIAKIANSIVECGFRSPILIDENNIVLAWHGRLLAAKKIGMDQVPVIQYTDLTDIQKKKYRILDNRLADLAEYDAENLKIELESIWDESLTELFADIVDIWWECETVQDQDTSEQAIPKATPIRVSDIFVLGDHLLFCWDSTQTKSIQTIIPKNNTIDLIVTDPPYNVNYEWWSWMKIENDCMDDTIFEKFIADAYEQMINVQKEWWSIYVFHSDTYWDIFRKKMKDAWYKLSQCLVWNKNHIVMGRQDYHWKHEPILYWRKPWAAHSWYADRSQSTVLDFDKPNKNEIHPTMKPIELLTYLIKNSSKKWECVFDPFGWSWSTLIACEMTGRVCKTIEIDPLYCHAIIKRYYEYTQWNKKIACINRDLDIDTILFDEKIKI